MDKAILLGHQAVVLLNTHTGDAMLVLLPEGVKRYRFYLHDQQYIIKLVGEKKAHRKRNKETIWPGPPSETSSNPESVLIFDYKAYTHE